jgi:hypothetical protein
MLPFFKQSRIWTQVLYGTVRYGVVRRGRARRGLAWGEGRFNRPSLI